MNKVEEVRKTTNDMVIEISNYIHNADISAKEKAERRFELAISLFISFIAMNTEEITKRKLARHLLILIRATRGMMEFNFYGEDKQ